MFRKLLSTSGAQKDHPILGISCTAAAMFLFGVMGVLAKLLSDDISPVGIAFYRNFIGAVCLGFLFLMTRKYEYFKTDRPKDHAVRSLIGTGGLILTYSALSMLTMSQATVFFFASSLILPVLGVVILKEYVGLPRWIAILIGFCGVIIASQPLGAVSVLGVFVALGAAFSHASVGICLRWLGKTEDALTTTFYFVLIGTLCLIPFLFFIDASVPASKIWMLIGVGLSGTLAQLFLTGAFKFADSAAISPVTYTSLIWSVGFDMLIWNAFPSWTVMIGATVIIGCNLYILYRERKVKMAAEKCEQATASS